MALSELERKRVEKTVGAYIQRHRPPPHIRPELDLAFRLQGQSVEIFEVRPDWKDPKSKMEKPCAKATYKKAQKTWRVFWQRQDLKWHSYKPTPEVATIEEFLALVEKDPHCCFFG